MRITVRTKLIPIRRKVAATQGGWGIFVNNGCINENLTGGTLGSFNTSIAGFTCTFDVQKAQEFAVGFWQDPHKGNMGRVRAGLQYEYVKLTAFPGAHRRWYTNQGLIPNNNIAFFSLRYYPFNRSEEANSTSRRALAAWAKRTKSRLSRAGGLVSGIDCSSAIVHHVADDCIRAHQDIVRTATRRGPAQARGNYICARNRHRRSIRSGDQKLTDPMPTRQRYQPSSSRRRSLKRRKKLAELAQQRVEPKMFLNTTKKIAWKGG